MTATRMSRTTSIGNSGSMRCALASIADAVSRFGTLTPGPTTRRDAEQQHGRQIRNERVVVVAHVADVQVLIYKLPGIDRLAVVEVELDHVGAGEKDAEALMHRASRQMGWTARRCWAGQRGQEPHDARRVAGQSWFAKGIRAGYYRTSTCNWLRQGNPQTIGSCIALNTWLALRT